MFTSISGELGYFPQGSICTFIRMQGCNLNCPYCDTKDSLQIRGGYLCEVERITPKSKNVIITGGEPMMQKEQLETLITHLVRQRCHIQIETNGTFYTLLELPFTNVSYVIDQKMHLPFQLRKPGIESRFYLSKDSWYKYLVSNEEQLYEAISEIEHVLLEMRDTEANFAISVVNDESGPKIPYATVLDKIRDYDLENHISLNFQMHKFVDLP
jgi:7-carboxy-7-deazaguanine synthase